MTARQRSGRVGLDYEAAVEEALCFGWVDSTGGVVDDEHGKLYFAPRKPRSAWAATNKARVERLIRDGQMRPAGLAAIDRAKANGSWTILDSVERLEVPDDLAVALERRPPAASNFAAFPPSARKTMLAVDRLRSTSGDPGRAGRRDRRGGRPERAGSLMTMKAAVRDRYGSTDVVRLDDVDRPIPGEDELLVRVHAASVNRADLDGLGPRPSFARLFMGLRRPRNPRLGIDVAGVVEAVGSSVTRFRPGDRVFADLFPFGPGGLRGVRRRPRDGVPGDPGRACPSRTRPPSRIRRSSPCRDSDSATAGRSGPATRVLIDGASGNVGSVRRPDREVAAARR